MKILLLGGTQEGKQLASRLANLSQIELIYSTKRAVAPPSANYTTIYGGFGGVDGLARKLTEEGFDLLLDMSYPYATQISQNAVAAARLSSLPVWGFQPPQSIAEAGDQWHFCPSLTELMTAIKPYHRCLFTLGGKAPPSANKIPPHQHWFIRGAPEERSHPQKTFIKGGRALSFEEALRLFSSLKIDALISHDSGSEASKRKIEAARVASIPLFFISRPAPQKTDRQFDTIASIEKALFLKTTA